MLNTYMLNTYMFNTYMLNIYMLNKYILKTKLNEFAHLNEVMFIYFCINLVIYLNQN